MPLNDRCLVSERISDIHSHALNVLYKWPLTAIWVVGMRCRVSTFLVHPSLSTLRVSRLGFIPFSSSTDLPLSPYTITFTAAASAHIDVRVPTGFLVCFDSSYMRLERTSRFCCLLGLVLRPQFL